MPELGDNRIGKILTRYYQAGLGGKENFDRLESLNMLGKIKTESGELLLSVWHKKPEYIKMELTHEKTQSRVTLAFDGKVAWKQEGKRAEPTPMTKSEARRFIHSSRFGNYLLYPFAQGKRIRLIDTVPVEGSICHQIRVELDTEYQVDYFIDIQTSLEVKVVNKDLRTGSVNSMVYRDYTRDYGVPIARKVESKEEGKWVSTLILEEIKLNTGIMPWMFHMPE
ncbi:MAG: hypothetical protein ACPGSB_10620 [Opitutales bacterium]